MERICVIVRARPLSPDDAKSSPWKLAGNSIFLGNNVARFEFDRIFGEGCSTREVYEARTKEIVASVIRGFNGTVFAYGQTNSGKTHTMRGSTKEPGIIPLAVRDLFRSIEENTDREFLVRMSYMEIYNEEINDLLAPEHRKLQIHESLERGIFVAGLREEIVVSPEQITELMEFGESHRHVGETNMNIHSSRSHTIFRMIIESRERNDDHGDCDSDNPCDAVRVSVLNLVDLAGSERAAKTGAEGVRLKEGSHINKSLMTLGTVIKKLSEGAESQGNHVPFRDSKLTRILQPALGGNANTAIICNITLAQIHSEETKSSLQFASRAIRVKSFACVNEILTDAALLKRQQKEIEELRAGLLASHSEHWEQEILNLRNTLLQSELEKERIALELEEEKKAKAQRERRLQEQEIKIANLSSMVLDTKRDDNSSAGKKNSRRNTWCPVPLASNSVSNITIEKNAVVAVPFKELMQKDRASKLEAICEDILPHNDIISRGNCGLLDSRALLNVTSRKKIRRKSLGSPVGKELNAESEQAEAEMKFFSGMIDTGSECIREESECSSGFNSSVLKNGNECATLRDPEIALISYQLQESMTNILMEKIQETSFEVQHASNAVEEASSFIEDIFQDFCSLKNEFLDLGTLASQNRAQVKAISDDREKLFEFLKRKNEKLEIEKGVLLQKTSDLDNRVQELIFDKQEKENEVTEMALQHKVEKDKLLDEISGLQKQVSRLSSSSFLAKEKEAAWKELEKTKSKLKDTESKLKNAIQDRVRLESEKAQAERETKRLRSQKALHERDLNRRESIARYESKGPDLIKSKGHGAPINQIRQADYDKLEMCAIEMEAEIASLEQKLMAEINEKEEALLKNGFLEDEVEALSRKLNTADSELTILREQIGTMALRIDECDCIQQELQASYDLVSSEKEEMAMQLTDALLEFETEKSAWSATEKVLLKSDEISRKEIAELSVNLAKNRLERGEKREENNRKIKEINPKMTDVKGELESCCKLSGVLEERLALSEANLSTERGISFAKLTEMAQLRNELELLEVDDLVFKNVIKSTFEVLSSGLGVACQQVNALRSQLSYLQEDRASYQSEIVEISEQLGNQLSSAKEEVKELIEKTLEIESKAQQETLKNGIERAKLKRMLSSTEAQLQAFRGRYVEAIREMDLMNRNFVEASADLKKKLATSCLQILNLKKHIATSSARPS